MKRFILLILIFLATLLRQMFKLLYFKTYFINVSLSLFLSLSCSFAWAGEQLEYRLDKVLPQMPFAWDFGSLGRIAFADNDSFWLENDYIAGRGSIIRLSVNNGQILETIDDLSVEVPLFLQKFFSEGQEETVWEIKGNGTQIIHYDKDGNEILNLSNNCEDSIRINKQGGDYDRVLYLDSNGNATFNIGEEGEGRRSPQSFIKSADGSFWVIGFSNDYLQHFRSDGSFIEQVGSKGSALGQFDWPVNIKIASDDSFWVVDRKNYRLQHFKQDGSFIGQVGSKGSAPGQFGLVDAIDIAPDDSLWVVDGNNFRVQHFSNTGVFLSAFGDSELFNGLNFFIKVAADGSLFIGDKDPIRRYNIFTDNSRVRHFSSGGLLIGELIGSIPFHHHGIEDIVLEEDGSLWVKDRYHLQHFSADGSYIEYFSKPDEDNGECKTDRPGRFNRVHDIAEQKNGDIWVADNGNHNVQHLNSQGKSLSVIGTEFLKSPIAITLGADESIWVVDYWQHQVFHFNQDGSLIAQIGSRGSKAGQFIHPVGIAISPDGSILVVDRGNRRIQHLTEKGEFIKQFGRANDDATIEVIFDRPGDIAIQVDGSMMMANQEYSATIQFDFLGNIISQAGIEVPTDSSSPKTDLIVDVGLPANDGSLWRISALNPNNLERIKNGKVEARIDSSVDAELMTYLIHRAKTARDGSVWVLYSKSFAAGIGTMTVYRMIHYDTEGLVISELPEGMFVEGLGWLPGEPFFTPSVDGQHLWLLDGLERMVRLVDSAGRTIEHFDVPNEKNKKFTRLSGISMDAEGALWVSDTGYHRLLKFVPKKRKNVAVDYDEVKNILYISDVNVAGRHHQVSLGFKDNLFSLRSLSPASYLFEPAAGFDPQTNILTIPLVTIAEKDYSASLKLVNDTQFKLLSVDLRK